MKLKSYIAAALVALSIPSASAFDPTELLGKAASAVGGDSKAGDVLGGVLGVVDQLTGGSDVEYSQLVGEWKYAKPAVSFKSDNLLQQAGGAAASSVIVNKIEPYYKKLGINKATIKFEEDGKFIFKAGKISTSGTVTRADNGQYVFSFTAFGVIPAGKVNAYITRAGKNVSLTFDASRLMSIIKGVASLSGNSTVKTFSDLLNSYDGLILGIEIKK